MSFRCNDCEYSSSKKYNLKIHVINNHIKIQNRRIICSICKYKCSHRNHLIRHLTEVHDECIQKQTLTFASASEFSVWKKGIELTNLCRYVLKSGTRLRKEVLERRFYCHRDGYFCAKVPRKKSLKCQGSNKINASCPSQIIYKEYPQGKVQVSYITSHHGHDEENTEAAIAAGISENSSSKKNRIICPVCRSIFSKYTFFHAHLSHLHGIPLDQQELIFPSEQDFQKWKISAEKRTKSMFVQDSSSKILNNGKVTYYFCHRSFHFIKKGTTGRQKRLGSNKSGIACPAMMHVTVGANAVHVNFCNTHIGHDLEVERLRRSSEGRMALAGKFDTGDSLLKVLDEGDGEPTEYDGIRLLERSDQNDNETGSNEWIEKLTQHRETENPVLFFKDRDVKHENFEKSDLILVIMTEFQKIMIKAFGHKVVCVDSMRGGTDGQELHIFTIVVLDEYDKGVPVAFCCANRCTKDLYKFFFSEVEKAIGQTVTSDIFMSESDTAAYSAWQETMAGAKKRLICRWHVNKIWETSTSSKVLNISKREVVRKVLRNLMSETNKRMFHAELTNFLTQRQNDPETNDFFQYFADNYADNVHLWAQCYRPLALLNIDLRLQALREAVGCDDSNGTGTPCIRPEAAVRGLLRLTRTTERERRIESARRTPDKILKTISRNHERSSDYLDNVRSNGEDGWAVTCGTDPGKVYDVNVAKYEPCCSHVCAECRICVHMLRCSCTANTLPQNICEHVHAAVRHSLRQYLEDDDFADESHRSRDIVLVFDKNSGDFLHAITDEKISLDELKNEITTKCNVVQGVLPKSEVTADQCRRILEYLDAISSVLNENISPRSTTKKISHSETDLFFR